MRQLSGQDASFLYSDSVHANSNVTFVQIYDQSTAPGGKVRFKSILAHIESRLHRSPVFRNKLKRVPLELDYPYWVEDEFFDLEYHVRHIALPAPGDWRQFCIQASRIHARALDLHRPLWEIYVIEGLDSFVDLPKGSFALLTKIHHAAIGAERHHDFIEVLHDATQQPPAPTPPEPWFPERAPGAVKLMCRGAVRSLVPPNRLIAPLARLAPVALAFARDLLQPQAQTAIRFNSVVSPHRVFDTRRFGLPEFQRICALVPGATLDDAALAVIAGGLRRYLDGHDELPDADLAALATLHGEEDPVGSWQRVQLATTEADAVRRLALIRAQTAADVSRSRAGAGPGAAAGTAGMPAATLAVAGRLFGRSSVSSTPGGPLTACTVTQVPGPTVPLYLIGARMTYFSALLPISDGAALVFALTTYDGRVVLSPTSCRELMPDPQAFTQCLRDSFQELLALADGAAAAPAPARPRRARPAKPGASAAGTRGPRAPRAKKAATAPAAAPAGRRRSTAPPR